MSSDCCNEFSRSSLMRKAVAQAGSGLPAIEPGMPVPAGTGLDRRSFLARSVGLALAVYGGTMLMAQDLGNAGLWTAFLVFLAVRGLGQAVLSRRLTRQAFG